MEPLRQRKGLFPDDATTVDDHELRAGILTSRLWGCSALVRPHRGEPSPAPDRWGYCSVSGHEVFELLVRSEHRKRPHDECACASRGPPLAKVPAPLPEATIKIAGK